MGRIVFATLALAACTQLGAEGMAYDAASSTAAQDNACAEALAGRTDASIGEVTVASRHAEPDGTARIKVETGDYRATCEVDADLNVLSFALMR